MASPVSVNNADVLNIFKRVYGNISTLIPKGYPSQELIVFSDKEKVGSDYVESVVLTNETGITLGGSAGDIFDLIPARAGVVKQTTVVPYVSVLSSVVPWSVLSRSAQAGDKAFVQGTKHIVENNLRSHMQFKEVFSMYGQSPDLLGYVSYFTGTYRGVSFTTGTGTLATVAFTNGVNTTSKAILLAPGSFAAGIWIGMDGVQVNQVNSSGVIVASGSLLSCDPDNGILYVDFTPVVATSTTSHRLCFGGQELAKDMIGINKVLTNTGTLFGISAAASTGYSLWRGSTTALGAVLLTFNRLQTAAAAASNRGGLMQDVDVLVNPRSFVSLLNAQAALRQYDDSYKTSGYENGAQEIVFFYAGGKMTIKPSRYCKEGEAYGIVSDSWVRSGSAQISLKVPGMEGKDLIYPAENSSAYIFRSFSDEYLFCRRPAVNFYISGINDESAT